MAPLRNRIIGNHIHHGGLIRYYGAGIHLDSRPYATALNAGNLVSHNYIHNMSRCGIFAFRNQGGNIFEYNHIHDVMLQTVDGGGIHTAPINTLAAPIKIKSNLIYDVYSPMIRREEQENNAPKMYKHNYGIYLDWVSSSVDVMYNVIWGCDWGRDLSGAFTANGGVNNRITNNLYAGYIRDGNLWSGFKGTLISNNTQDVNVPLMYDKTQIGPFGNATYFIGWELLEKEGYIVDYTDSSHVKIVGNWNVDGIGIANFLNDGNTGKGQKKVRFTPPLKDGIYDVYAVWTTTPDRAFKVPLTVACDGDTKTIYVNQRAHGSFERADTGWYHLGEFTFAVQEGKPGDRQYLEISNEGTAGDVIAQTVAFIKK